MKGGCYFSFNSQQQHHHQTHIRSRHKVQQFQTRRKDELSTKRENPSNTRMRFFLGTPFFLLCYCYSVLLLVGSCSCFQPSRHQHLQSPRHSNKVHPPRLLNALLPEDDGVKKKKKKIGNDDSTVTVVTDSYSSEE